jgi:hypothetical protein
MLFAAHRVCLMGSFDSSSWELEVTLDGTLVTIPTDRRSLNGIRSYLDAIALQQQRILCWLSVDGEPINLTQPRNTQTEFARVEAETMSLGEVPVQLVKAALQQTNTIRTRIHSAVELVMINEAPQARELWWNLSTTLKEPLLTLSLLPDTAFGPEIGGAPLLQLRRWQLQQLGCVINDVDHACGSEDSAQLSDALEKRVLDWLDSLQESLTLWHDTLSATQQAEAIQQS